MAGIFTQRDIDLAKARGSIDALKVIVEIVGELQEEHDEAELMGRYQILLSNWVKLQLILLNEMEDMTAYALELASKE